MPRCLRCGTDNKATARFCRQCGAAMPDLASVEDDDSTALEQRKRLPLPSAPRQGLAQRRRSKPNPARRDARIPLHAPFRLRRGAGALVSAS